MTRPKGTPPRNVAASVKARLLELAHKRGEDFNFLLNRYVLERWLYRLAQSPHKDSFLLKGAMLFTVWSKQPHRATKDIDLLGHGSPGAARLVPMFADVCWRSSCSARAKSSSQALAAFRPAHHLLLVSSPRFARARLIGSLACSPQGQRD